MSTETEAMWKTLSRLALEAKQLHIAERYRQEPSTPLNTFPSGGHCPPESLSQWPRFWPRRTVHFNVTCEPGCMVFSSPGGGFAHVA